MAIDNLTKSMIGFFIKLNPLFGDEPYFSILKDFKSKFVKNLEIKSKKGNCSLLLFKIDKNIMEYEDILDSIDFIFNAPIAVEFNETFFIENDHEYYLDGVKLDKNNIYNNIPCNLAIFTTDENLIKYFSN